MTLGEKLAPQEFVADLVWAARALGSQPTVALVSIAVWLLPQFGPQDARGLLGFVFAVTTGAFTFGWLGAERLFFLRRSEGRAATLPNLLSGARRYVGRFFRLACLVSVPFLVMRFFLGPYSRHATTERIALVSFAVALDLALTFVTPALVFTTRSARQAIRIGWQMIRQTWRYSRLYVVCPPLALNMLNTVYPMQDHLVRVPATAGLAVLALLAKGATAAFYLRERPVVPGVVGDDV
jgi:hypothetical protein